MTAIPDKTAADPQQIIAELERKLDERTSERDEALERQTATADILQVIARSPSDVQPVFDAVAERAMSLLNCWSAIVVSFDGELVHFGAACGALPDTEQIVRQRFQSMRPYRASLLGRCLLERTVVNSADAQAEPDPQLRDYARKRGLRAVLCVPLLRDDKVEGALVLTRAQPGLFAPREIELVQTFADQAVIAIHNARLFNETKQALEHQTATSEVLQVIGNSMADAKPVFERIVNSIERLFDCRQIAIFVTPGDGLVHLAARRGMNMELMDEAYPLPIEQSAVPAVLGARQQIYYPDALNGANVPQSIRRVAQVIGNFSDVLTPMLWEGRGVGMIAVTREPNTPFNSKELSLLRTFADQTAIAIENARLFDEVQAKTRDLEEALEQESAGSEVLKLISMSSGDLEPVFQKLLESATRLCGAELGIMNLLSGGMVRQVSFYNMPEAYVSEWSGKPYPPHPESVMGTVMRTRQAVHVDDLRTRPAYSAGNPAVVALSDIAGARTYVGVPLLQRDELVGMISIYRREVRPFDEKQVQLVERFASQAVIALENARLLNELRERTHQLSRSLENLRATQDRLIQTEKLASLGQLTAGIAHEIKNPLNFVTNFSALSAELIAELKDVLGRATLVDNLRTEVEELTGLLKDNLDKVVQHGKRADAIVKNMLLHSREGSGERRSADINALVKESLNLAYHGARAEKAGFKIGLRHDLDANAGAIEIYPQEITRALLNLISNGFYAATTRKLEVGDESFEPFLCVATRDLGKTVEIRIRDNGTGIPPEIREKIFNPFFTTKPTGEGTGLGLSISHDIIVKQHGGRIDIETEPAVFTEFIVTLPRDIGPRGAEKPE
jgi:signal transduction histidine kinase